MSSRRLTDTSYVVLGLVEHLAPATPYALKQMAAVSTVHFWTIPHTQIYTECARLAESGLLSEEREETGRRRRIYRLTPAGEDALARWRRDTTSETFELRDAAILKLFFGADPNTLARAQLAAHEGRLAHYEELHAEMGEAPDGWRLALESGIGHEREFVRYWSQMIDRDA